MTKIKSKQQRVKKEQKDSSYNSQSITVSFYRSVNAIFGKVLSTATVDVILHLINSKCLPVLLYGLKVCPLTKADMQSLDFCVNMILMKLFVTNNSSIVDECRHFFNFELPSELLCKRTAKFLHNCTHTVINLFLYLV